MVRVLSAALLILASYAIGCETGSQRENISTTGADGQKVGMSSNQKDGPVPGSTTGLKGDTQQQPAQERQETAPDTSGQPAPPK